MVAQQPAQRNAARKRRARSVVATLQASGFTATILALIVTGVVVLAPSLRVLAEQRQQIAALKAELVQAEEQVLELEDQLARWSDRVYVETQARSRLMFVYPGDITYLVLDDLPAPNGDSEQEVTQEVQVTERDWRQALLASFLVAATTDVSQWPVSERELPPLPSPTEGGQEEESP